MFFFYAWQLFFEAGRPQGFGSWALRILLDELVLGGLLFFTLGFLWALSGNGRLKGWLDIVAVKWAWIVIPLAMVSLVGAACVVIFA